MWRNYLAFTLASIQLVGADFFQFGYLAVRLNLLLSENTRKALGYHASAIMSKAQ
jgi:hypothetical protein